MDIEGFNWKNVSQETKDFYYKKFKKRYFWDPIVEVGIKAMWKVKVAMHCKDIIADLKERGRHT
uniref:Uncharacterized protein n=1 Tax=Manihot esculenta TaxID=3983 RepID=A0A2C9VEK9_MANES